MTKSKLNLILGVFCLVFAAGVGAQDAPEACNMTTHPQQTCSSSTDRCCPNSNHMGGGGICVDKRLECHHFVGE